MKRLVVATCLALATSIVISDTASSQDGFAYSYSPFGFGLPFARFGGAVQTPPYFAMNPPVYYGARYARPYGISPFPASPMVNAPADYMGAPAARFYYPPVPAPAPSCNPYIIGQRSDATGPASPKLAVLGEIRTNPFVQTDDRLAQK